MQIEQMLSRAALGVVRPYFNGGEFRDLGCQPINPFKDPREITVTVYEVNCPLITYLATKQRKGPEILRDPRQGCHLRLYFDNRVIASHVAWTVNQQVRLRITCPQSGQDRMSCLVHLTIQPEWPVVGPAPPHLVAKLVTVDTLAINGSATVHRQSEILITNISRSRSQKGAQNIHSPPTHDSL
jgi:hypothetical protein